MANLIQIKRSTSNATVSGLSAGELAFTQASNTLWIGLPDGTNNVIRIAGAQYPGILTANQALVANSSSAIDKIIVANLVATSIYANGSFGTANQVLRSDGANVYWSEDPGDISNIIAGNGLTGGGAFGNVTISANPGTNGGLLANSDGLWVVGGTGVTVNSSGVSIGQDVATTSNVTFLNVTSSNNLFVSGNVGIGTTNPASILNVKGINPSFTIGDTRNQSWTVNDRLSSIDFSSDDSSCGGTVNKVRTRIETYVADTFGCSHGLGFYAVDIVDGVLRKHMTMSSRGALTLGHSRKDQTQLITYTQSSSPMTPIQLIDTYMGQGFTSLLFTSTLSDNITTYNAGSIGIFAADKTANGSGSLVFNTKDTTDASPLERLRIVGNGTVGIGTTTPTAKLTVASGAAATSQHIYGTYTDASNYERINVTANSTGHYITGEEAGTGLARPFYFGANNNSHMTIATNGNIGLGTPTPETRLHSYANNTSFNRIYVQQDGNGRAGIRLKTPISDWILETVTGFDAGALLLFDNSPNGASNYAFKFTKKGIETLNGSNTTPAYSFINDNNTGMYKPLDDTLGLVTNGIERIRVTSSGNIGIDNLTPPEKLSVNGNVLANGNLTVTGNTVIGSNTSDIVTFNALVSSNVIPSANMTYHLGNNTLRWAQVHSGNLHAVTGTFDGSVYVAGDLVVVGNVTTINVNSVVVSDPMIYLAGNNYLSDLVDIGLAANYNDGQNRHTGLFRDHTDGIWKLFTNLTQELSGNNDVDTSDPSYRIATLQAFLESSGLITNSSTVSITANSTVNVNIIANTITLSTALAATSGGTGLNSYTGGDILVAANSTTLNTLSLGVGGYVLQSTGSALVYDSLDGGVF